MCDTWGEMENERERSDEEFVHDEEEAAGSEAGRIGGTGGADEVTDEAKRPLAESGEGQAEGFELAEHDLIENAGDMGGPDPSDEAFTPEEERSGAEYGESDHVESSETTDDDEGSGD
jgi:hypothetical protein